MQIKNRFDFIDALRGIAIFGVIVVHSAPGFHLPYWVQPITGNGSRGVQLFYIVSAFTLFYSLKCVRVSEKHLYINYIIRRFFRIAPLYYLAIIIFLLKDGFGPRHFLGDIPSITYSNILSTLLFINGFNPYWINSIVPGGWSIAVEMMFYAALPFMIKKMSDIKKAAIITVITLIVVNIIKYILMRHPVISCERLWDEYLFLWFPNQLPIFCLGIIFYYIFQIHSEHKNENNSYKIRGLIYVLIALIVGISLCYPEILPLRVFLISLCFILFLYGIYIYPLKIFVNRFWIYLGKISFSCYLIHFALISPIAIIYKRLILNLGLNLPSLINYFLFLGLTLPIIMIISSITYYLIEKPGINLGRVLINKLESRNYEIISRKYLQRLFLLKTRILNYNYHLKK